MLLARWFRFQPSEIEGLETSDFEQWVKLASEQISAQATKLRELERGA